MDIWFASTVILSEITSYDVTISQSQYQQDEEKNKYLINGLIKCCCTMPQHHQFAQIHTVRVSRQ